MQKHTQKNQKTTKCHKHNYIDKLACRSTRECNAAINAYFGVDCVGLVHS